MTHRHPAANLCAHVAIGRNIIVALIRKYSIFITSVLVIVLGYILLASGEITLAPILLVAGYCVMIPVFLIRSFLNKGE